MYGASIVIYSIRFWKYVCRAAGFEAIAARAIERRRQKERETEGEE